MRKIINLLFVLVVVCSIATIAFAAEGELLVSDVEAGPGDVVYIPVSLNARLEGTAMGVSFSYDEKILELKQDSCTWEIQGFMSNFDGKKGHGAWAAQQETVLYGDVCVLAFQVRNNAHLTRTMVEISLIVKNLDQEVGTYYAEAVIGQPCEHEFGPWASNGDWHHSQTCMSCDKTVTQSHLWNAGVKNTDANGRTEMIYECDVCHGRRAIFLENAPVSGTGPDNDPTAPTSPVNRPGQDASRPNSQPEWVDNDSNRNDHDHTVPEDTDHSVNDAPTEHIHEENITDPIDEDPHDHTHETQTVKESNPITGVVVIAAVVILLAGAVYFVKKR